MRIIKNSVLLFLASLSLTANATIIDIEYSGVIYHATGDSARLGYAIGNRITGSMHVDLSLANDPEGNILTPEMSYFAFSGPGAGMISEPGKPVPSSSSSYAYAYNNAEPITGHDYAMFSNGISFSDDYTSIALSIKIGALDWIPSTTLEGIDVVVNDAELLKNSMGIGYKADRISPTLSYNSAMQMRFDYLKIVSAKPASVPEPGSLSLAILGLIALCIHMIRRHSALSPHGSGTKSKRIPLETEQKIAI